MKIIMLIILIKDDFGIPHEFTEINKGKKDGRLFLPFFYSA